MIYARNIQLRYVPPEQLPAPFPETLRIEGGSCGFENVEVLMWKCRITAIFRFGGCREDIVEYAVSRHAPRFEVCGRIILGPPGTAIPGWIHRSRVESCR
jgi:hypothetical protein